MNKTILRILNIITTTCILVGLSVSAWAAVDLEEVQKGVVFSNGRIDSYSGQLDRMRGRYVTTQFINQAKVFVNRFETAEKLYRAGDYVNAAIICVDLMDYPNAKAKRQFYDIQFYLGSSLFHQGNYISARKYLEKVVDYGQIGEHFREAILEMIEIYVTQRDFTGAERYYKLISRVSGQSGWDSIQYEYAKMLHKKMDLDKSERTFAKIPSDSAMYPRAAYFRGVIKVEQKKLKEALKIFQGLRNIETKDIKDLRLRELATLATARVLFDLGQFDEALSVYRDIPVESPFFDQAYHEICWIYVKREKADEAANTLDILLIARPDSKYEPEFRLLKGSINLWSGDYDKANMSFRHVSDKYETVVERLERLLNVSKGKRAEEIQRDVLSKDSKLPPIVRVWLSQEELVSDSLAICDELEQSSEGLKESEKVVETLDLHLSQKNKANLFPQLRIGRERGIELKSNLTEESSILATLATNLVGKFSPEDKKKLEKLRNRRKELEKKYAEMPKTMADRHDRRSRHVDRMSDVDKEIYKLQLQLDGLNELIADIESRQENVRGNPKMSQDYIRKVSQKIIREQKQMSTMLNDMGGLVGEVQREMEMAKIGEEADQRDEAIRKEIVRISKEEEDLVARLGAGFTEEGRLLFKQIEENRKRAERLNGNVEVYFGDLEKLVVEAVAGYSRKLESEKRMILGYNQQIERYRRESEMLSGIIAYHNLQAVHDRFYDYVLRADMGMVDISWEKRQRIRGRIDELLEQRAQDMEALDEGFRAVREGSL